MPSSPQEAAMRWAFMSSPKAVSMRTSTPSRAMLWAMFRPTPPRLMRTWPGLESAPTSFPWGRPPMSMLTPPTTTA